MWCDEWGEGTGNGRAREKMVEVEADATYYEIVAYPRGDLCERVGVAGRDEDDVCPAPELDVQYRVSDAVAWLRVRRRRRRRGEGEK